MKTLASILFFCWFAQLAAQKLYVYPTTAIAPRGSYQSVTAVVTGVNDKTVTWRTSGGTLVGTNPCIVNEPCTIAVYDRTPETDTLTATSNASGSVLATSTLTFTASPAPVTTWPRFLITQANLPSLRAKATSGNVMYRGLKNGAIAAYNKDNAASAWGSSWTCKSGNGQPATSQLANSKEYDAFSFAYMALIDPSDATYNWGCYAHDVGMYVMTQYPRIGPPYYFPGQQNEWSDGSFIWGVLGDWLRGSNAVTTSADLATMRTFYSYLVHATLQLGNYPTPTAAYNSSAMFRGHSSMGANYGPGPSDLNNMRGESGNNYSLSRILILTAAGLTFNDNTTDAPNIPTGTYNTCGATRYQVCPDGTAGSLRAYWNYLDGAVLYNYWAHLEDPNVSWQAYQAAYANLPTQPKCESTDLLTYPCFGDGRDGGSAEGNYYDYSMYRARWALNMLHTAGMDDPLLYGPQISVGTSSWWDLKYVHDLEILTGPTQQYYGSGYTLYPTYSFLTMGDMYTYNRAVSDAGTEAALLTFDSETGRTDRANALKWINFNYAYGGPLGTSAGCTVNCGYDNNIANGYIASITPLDMFIALPAGDPVGGSLPADPRPSLPTDFFDGSFNQNGIVRSSWASSGVLLSYWFNNSQNNHEYNYDGRFDVYSNGEYITKGRAIFTDYNVFMVAANQQNELGILNSTGSTCTSGCEFWQQLQNKGQLSQGLQGGMVTVTHSELPAYAAAIGNTTNAYNGGVAGPYYRPYNDVKSASRSILFLRESNQQVVYYDRAAVGHAASTQSLHQVTTGSPTISGPTASWLTRSSKQQAYYTSLLPSGGTIANAGLPCQTGYCNAATQAQDWEPAAVLQVTPPGTPTSSQFLSVLEWGPTGFSKTSTALVQSTAGQNFDGALVGTSLVMFMRNWPNTFTNTTYPASGATTHYISDLTPNTTYAISGAGAPTSGTTDTAGVLVFSAAGTGDIVIQSVAKTAAPAKNGTAPRRAALYGAGAVAAMIVVGSCLARIWPSRTTRTDPLVG
jgi:hypothetical protein